MRCLHLLELSSAFWVWGVAAVALIMDLIGLVADYVPGGRLALIRFCDDHELDLHLDFLRAANFQQEFRRHVQKSHESTLTPEGELGLLAIASLFLENVNADNEAARIPRSRVTRIDKIPVSLSGRMMSQKVTHGLYLAHGLDFPEVVRMKRFCLVNDLEWKHVHTLLNETLLRPERHHFDLKEYLDREIILRPGRNRFDLRSEEIYEALRYFVAAFPVFTSNTALATEPDDRHEFLPRAEREILNHWVKRRRVELSLNLRKQGDRFFEADSMRKVRIGDDTGRIGGDMVIYFGWRFIESNLYACRLMFKYLAKNFWILPNLCFRSNVYFYEIQRRCALVEKFMEHKPVWFH